MEEQTFNLVGQYGALGLFAIVAVYMIKNMISESAERDREHMEERKEWRQLLKDQHDETLQVAKESNTNQRQIIALLTDLKGRLKDDMSKKK